MRRPGGPPRLAVTARRVAPAGVLGWWGAAPFRTRGWRFGDAEAALSLERFYTIHLASGALDEVLLCDQTYTTSEMTALLDAAGFADVQIYPDWDGLPLHAAAEWNVYVAQKRSEK